MRCARRAALQEEPFVSCFVSEGDLRMDQWIALVRSRWRYGDRVTVILRARLLYLSSLAISRADSVGIP